MTATEQAWACCTSTIGPACQHRAHPEATCLACIAGESQQHAEELAPRRILAVGFTLGPIGQSGRIISTARNAESAQVFG